MVSLQIDVNVDAVTAKLGRYSRRLRETLEGKMSDVVSVAKADILQSFTGKFLDPSTINTDVFTSGLETVGVIESHDKPGVYAIYPTKARVLRFIAKSGDLVLTPRVLLHPFPKGGKTVLETMIELKPWIESQLREAVSEALR